MNDLRLPCQRWAEAISLAAAGCLPAAEAQDVERHLVECAACREHRRELDALVGVLADARAPADEADAATVERIWSAVAAATAQDAGRRGQETRAERGQTETIHPTLLSRSLDRWRWIMRSPVSRVSAAAVLLVAITGVALWFQGGGATYAFADFIAPILEAKTARFKLATEMKGPPAMTITAEVMVLGPARARQEMGGPGGAQSIFISDWGKGKSLVLVPATKKATLVTAANLTPEQVAKQDMFGQFRAILADALDEPDMRREALGEKEIDGRRVVGYRLSGRSTVVELWGDPETGLPVRVDTTMALYPNAKTTMSDFEFNVPLDESLFSVEPPAGYTVEEQTVDVSQPVERDLVEGLRGYGQAVGTFPDAFDLVQSTEVIGKRLAMETLWEMFAPQRDKPGVEQMKRIMAAGSDEQIREAVFDEMFKDLKPEEREQAKAEVREKITAQMPAYIQAFTQKLSAAQIRMQRGMLFAHMLPSEAEARYVGKGVSFGAADKPIFWYRPAGSEKYRVIYADLSTREAEKAPEVEGAAAVSAAAKE